MNLRKVKPAFEERPGFEHVSGCFKYFFIFSVKFLLWTGLMLMRYGGKDKMCEFKLVSVSSFFSHFRLFIATFPNSSYLTTWFTEGHGKRSTKKYRRKIWHEVPVRSQRAPWSWILHEFSNLCFTLCLGLYWDWTFFNALWLPNEILWHVNRKAESYMWGMFFFW